MNESKPQNQPVQKRSEREISFFPHGSKDTIRLSVAIIKSMLCKPTKKGAICSDIQAMRFMMLCQARRLNPFEGDAYLVGYDGSDGPEFSLITAHQAFLKRAEVHPEFDGMESGVTLRTENGAIKDVPGDYFDAETDGKLVAGWARVHFKSRKFSTYRRVKLQRFDKGYSQWKVDPAGMIVKCAEADALRSSFPTLLGGCYTGEEGQSTSPELSGLVVTPPAVDNGHTDPPAQLSDNPEPERDEIPMGEAQPVDTRTNGDAMRQSVAARAAEPTSNGNATNELFKLVTEAGHDFTRFRAWADDTGNLENAMSYAAFSDLPDAFCKRMLNAKVGLLRGLAQLGKGKA